MKIAVISDTHSHPIPPPLARDLKRADVIVHAGDFCSKKDFDFFAQIKEVRAVWGNMDEAALKKNLPERLIFQAGIFSIGVYHGRGAPSTVLKSVEEAFKGERVDVIIFGHSHQPFNQKIKDILYFNPGSPTDKIRAPYPSYGLLEITSKAVSGHIIKLGYYSGHSRVRQRRIRLRRKSGNPSLRTILPNVF